MQQWKNVLLNDSIIEGKAVSKFILEDPVEYWFNDWGNK